MPSAISLSAVLAREIPAVDGAGPTTAVPNPPARLPAPERVRCSETVSFGAGDTTSILPISTSPTLRRSLSVITGGGPITEVSRPGLLVNLSAACGFGAGETGCVSKAIADLERPFESSGAGSTTVGWITVLLL